MCERDECMDQLAAYKFINNIIVYSNAAVRDNRRQLKLLGKWFRQNRTRNWNYHTKTIYHSFRLDQFITHFHYVYYVFVCMCVRCACACAVYATEYVRLSQCHLYCSCGFWYKWIQLKLQWKICIVWRTMQNIFGE